MVLKIKIEIYFQTFDLDHQAISDKIWHLENYLCFKFFIIIAFITKPELRKVFKRKI